MADRSTPPFRADHVGSLLRPKDLLTAREEHAAGRIGDDELRAREDGAIRQVVRDQESAGLRSATDGEFRRASWHMDFIYQLGGITKVTDQSLKVQFHNERGDIEFAPPSLHVDAPIGLEHTIFGDAFSFLRDTVGTATPKLTMDPNTHQVTFPTYLRVAVKSGSKYDEKLLGNLGAVKEPGV